MKTLRFSFYLISSFLLLLSGGAARLQGQGLTPSTPTKEFVYFNGRLIAIEERSGTQSGQARGITRPASGSSSPGPVAASATPGSATPVTAPPPGIPQTLPVPGTPPQAPTGDGPTFTATVPAATHAMIVPVPNN